MVPTFLRFLKWPVLTLHWRWETMYSVMKRMMTQSVIIMKTKSKRCWFSAPIHFTTATMCNLCSECQHRSDVRLPNNSLWWSDTIGSNNSRSSFDSGNDLATNYYLGPNHYQNQQWLIVIPKATYWNGILEVFRRIWSLSTTKILFSQWRPLHFGLILVKSMSAWFHW